MNHYETLGINQDATHDEIKRAWRSLAHENHPDTQHGDKERMVAINAAYAILKDPARRADYDLTLVSRSDSKFAQQPGFKSVQVPPTYDAVCSKQWEDFLRSDFTIRPCMCQTCHDTRMVTSRFTKELIPCAACKTAPVTSKFTKRR